MGGRAARGLGKQVVVVAVQPILVAAQPPAQSLDERCERQIEPRRQRPGHQIEDARAVPRGRQIGVVRHGGRLVGVEPRRQRLQHRNPASHPWPD